MGLDSELVGITVMVLNHLPGEDIHVFCRPHEMGLAARKQAREREIISSRTHLTTCLAAGSLKLEFKLDVRDAAAVVLQKNIF